MDKPFTFKLLLACIFMLWLPVMVRAEIPVRTTILSDAASPQEQEKKGEKGKEKPGSKQLPDKPGIAEVPKARKQSRPPVVKPKIKAKPVKIIRPKIKKP